MLDTDQQLWAARIRLHFEPHLRDIAEEVARIFVPVIGARVKELRRDTRMSEVLGWFEERRKLLNSSLDWVELIMSLEEIVQSEVSDEFAERFADHTLHELVVHLDAKRKAGAK